MATLKGPGAPVGNKNALKHGLYSSKILSSSAPALDDISLSSEIYLLRSLLDNYISRLSSDFDIDVLDTISAICLRISSIFKTHSLTSGTNPDLAAIIQSSISELSNNYD